jgi:hypothetical protein
VCASLDAAATVLPFDVLWAQYEAALVDHAVTVFAYFYHELKATPQALRERGKKVWSDGKRGEQECGVCRVAHQSCDTHSAEVGLVAAVKHWYRYILMDFIVEPSLVLR